MNNSPIIFKILDLHLDPSKLRDSMAIENRRSNTYFSKIIGSDQLLSKSSVTKSYNLRSNNNQPSNIQSNNNLSNNNQFNNNQSNFNQSNNNQSNNNQSLNNQSNNNQLNNKPNTFKPNMNNNKSIKPNIIKFIKKNKINKNFSLRQFF